MRFLKHACVVLLGAVHGRAVFERESPEPPPGSTRSLAAGGVGLVETNHNDQLASGRLQWSSESNHFYRADVYVFGKPPACSYAA